MPFRVAGWSGNIFFGFNVLRGVPGERPVRRGFQGTERTEKWQTFSVTVTKSVNGNRSGYVPLVQESFLTAEIAEKGQRSRRKAIQEGMFPQWYAVPHGLCVGPPTYFVEDFLHDL